MRKDVKYIIVTGGVVSGLGKGLAAASIGRLLSEDHKIVPIKCDGYLNTDPGTMNPVEHGEVYVLDDGTETDMDFGHYERFLGVSCKGDYNLTMGKVYSKILAAERKGEYLGKTVQLIPHVVDAILDWWQTLADNEGADVVLLEIGGTVGDMENELYLEAARRLHNQLGSDNVMFVHLTYVPVINGDEQKSKPTQQSIQKLGMRGISPDIIIARCVDLLTDSVKSKIALNADLPPERIITGKDVDNLYTIPLLFKQQGVDVICKKQLSLKTRTDEDLEKYKEYVSHFADSDDAVKVAICGKYTDVKDSYASVMTALLFAAAENKTYVNFDFIDTSLFENEPKKLDKELKEYAGIIIPGGFGSRGIEGKISVINYCRVNKIPYLGLCYGLQLAVVEFARNVCNLEDAHTTEVDAKTDNPVVDILPDKKDLENMGGTLRLGSYTAILEKDSTVYKLYGNKSEVEERHRHRYEVNPAYHDRLFSGDLKASGMSPDGRLVEYIELEGHPFFVATQAHPEFKNPSPLFVGFLKAVKNNV